MASLVSSHGWRVPLIFLWLAHHAWTFSCMRCKGPPRHSRSHCGLKLWPVRQGQYCQTAGMCPGCARQIGPGRAEVVIQSLQYWLLHSSDRWWPRGAISLLPRQIRSSCALWTCPSLYPERAQRFLWGICFSLKEGEKMKEKLTFSSYFPFIHISIFFPYSSNLWKILDCGFLSHKLIPQTFFKICYLMVPMCMWENTEIMSWKSRKAAGSWQLCGRCHVAELLLFWKKPRDWWSHVGDTELTDGSDAVSLVAACLEPNLPVLQ